MKTIKQLKFKTQPMCEDCGQPAQCFCGDKTKAPQWRFTCYDCAERYRYPFEIVRFFNRPSGTVDWLAHLHRKVWFDAKEFTAMMHRFRKATSSFWEC